MRRFIIRLAAASRPRLPETKPKWFEQRFEFETSCYALGRRIRRFAKVNVNKVITFYWIVLILVVSCPQPTKKHAKAPIEWSTKSARCDYQEVSTQSDNRHCLRATRPI